MNEYAHFFTKVSKHDKAHSWQKKLADSQNCGNRLIRIPTGFGKTLGVLTTWIWHRLQQRNEKWPRRLVWCLPMRVLVEQTGNEARKILESEDIDALWDGQEGTHDGKVGVHLLMGGTDTGQWYLYPEYDAVLIGTQDMLLSRAMNRGYACPRARWPMEFGLLNQDTLWVMDEVQLMDVGLATSGQLQAFRSKDRNDGKSLRPCFTWWMSATLQQAWLEKSPDTADLTEELAGNKHCIGSEDRVGHLWNNVTKTLKINQFSDQKKLAQTVIEQHKEGLTLVVLNTVERAVGAWKVLRQDKTLKDASTDIRLIHSRFRPAERRAWREEFLNREACGPGTNRIIVSTQVVEAGVDISASLLITELAPWPSLIQRFGRCARWGGTGQVIVADFGYDSDEKAAPYSKDELDASRDACQALPDAGPNHLEQFEEKNGALLPRLYPYEPAHLLLRHELDELFDTSPDLSGADIDISRFIRSGNERDVQVFWAEVADDDPPSNMKPTRDELCSIPFLKTRDWLCKPKSENLKPGVQAWVWDWLDRKWRKVSRRDIYPGQTVLIESTVGGYRNDRGWDPESEERVKPIQSDYAIRHKKKLCWKRRNGGWQPGETRRLIRVPKSENDANAAEADEFLKPEDDADAAEDDESLSITDNWQTIASHGLEVGKKVQCIAEQMQVEPNFARLLHLAGRWHDLGKAHPAFQSSIQADTRPEREDIAKAPDIAWPCSFNNLYRINAGDQRRGFRHELASTLGLFGVLQRHNPEHQALLGPWRKWFDAMNEVNQNAIESSDESVNGNDISEPTAIEQEILNLTAQEFDLLAYLICSHHGKVRMAWHASSSDQKADDSRVRIRGIREGDILPPVQLAAVDGSFHQLPATELDLAPSEMGLSLRTGRSWSERVLSLVERFGPFNLAWLEAALRSADMRASRQVATEDPLLQKQENYHAKHQLDIDSETVRVPYSATRYVKTSIGILSHQKLVSLLTERIADIEQAIAKRALAGLRIYDLLPELHRRICANLTPNIAGHWRSRDVRAGKRKAPTYSRIPTLMRDYTNDLEARWNGNNGKLDKERIDRSFAFTENQLRYIHPFEEFNDHVTHLFLIEIRRRFAQRGLQ